MTPEQLDEIERLAEAATPGPWQAQLSDKGHALWGPLPNGECGSMRIALSSYAAFDRANMLFMEALRDAALPLVKALREARERDEQHFKMLEQYRLEVEDCKRRVGDMVDHLAREEADAHQFQKERDEARAEVKRLREVAKHSFTLDQITATMKQAIDECANNSTPMPRRQRRVKKIERQD